MGSRAGEAGVAAMKSEKIKFNAHLSLIIENSRTERPAKMQWNGKGEPEKIAEQNKK